MNFFVFYLFRRLIYRFGDFWTHWYGHSFYIILRWLNLVVRSLDRRLALKITLKNFFRPLYQDYTIIGYLMGMFFRSIRIMIAAVFYVGMAAIAVFLYLGWALAPVYVIFRMMSAYIKL